MIPSVISKQVRHGIEDFIKTTFPVHTAFFNGIFDRFLDRKSNEMFRGPYISVKLPFRPGLKGAGYFPDIPMKYSPFLHQEQAFNRLGDKTPKSTIIATGTGSGKTECFMYPILDYCFAKRGEPGIKAIIIYPMNALANDQARRFAEDIYGNSNLKGNVRVGLFIGETSSENSPMMTKDNVITDRNAMRVSPPDILLTNYKMLDYLLLRPIDRDIWQRNEPETLKYLVVDELHTFDGAQGTDLACLLRRLKSRLNTPSGHMCCVGTSATLGDTQKPGELISYAENVFGEEFGGSSVVGEKTLQPEEFFPDAQGDITSVPGKEHSKEMDPYEYSSIRDYVKAQAKLWFGFEIPDYDDGKWRVELGRRLCRHIFFRNLLTVICRKLVTLDELVQEMEKLNIEISEGDWEYRDFLIISLLALASSSSRQVDENSIMPFLNLRLQTWLKEMRRIVAEVKNAPDLKFANDLNVEEMEQHLPLVHCRECGTMGWLTSRKSQDTSIRQELEKIYESFFSHSPTVNYLFPEDPPGIRTEDADPLWNNFICGHCMRTINVGAGNEKVCSNCGKNDNFIKAYISNNTLTNLNGRRSTSHNCPYCNSAESLTIIGSRAPSLISVAISQIFTSIYNDDKKILAFSDSVQDAAHRAGFFSARTFRFGLRTAIQQFISESERTFTLAELPESFSKYYLDRFDREKFISTFIATDMEWLDDYEYLLKHDRLPDNSELLNLCKMRIGWEIFSEYGFRCRIGRTLEKTGSSVASFNNAGIDKAVKSSIEILQNQIGGLRKLDEDRLHSFVLGFLMLLKSKGGVAHSALEGYIKNFGNYYQLSNVYPNELFMPKFGSHARTPVFLNTKPGTRFDYFLNEKTWYADWARRKLGDLEPDIHKYTDQLYAIILEHLVDSKVLQTWTPSDKKVWGINPDSLIISKKVFQLRCSHCGYLMSVGEAELGHFTGRPCLRMKCAGVYEPEKERADYYARLYSTGDIHRINAAEHSSLLERGDRENLEERFMAEENSMDMDKQRKSWYPNLLSCTPTLEMGINIGKLSAEIMCNIPPTKSSYLQRIGRTGRRDGNSFNLAVANVRPHDLYFFSNPPDMITGNVEAPGCFLNASSVLERQFIAFCFDNWVAGGIKVSDIPKNIGALERNYKSKDDGKFPFLFLKYIELNRTELFRNFIGIFPGMQEQTKERLKLFVEGKDGTGNLTYRILEPIESVFKEMVSLRGKIKSIKKSVETHKASPANSDHEAILEEMENELFALAKILGKISEKDIFNFFTDSGLLPNYAFPESGIQLKSLILRRRKKNDKGKFSVQIYEYERPAVTGIYELAPGSDFYAEGRKVTIDQINMKLAEVEEWRLCDSCPHMELVAKNPVPSPQCPNCGSSKWSDVGQKRKMLRMRQVIATTYDRDSRIYDDSDERKNQYYQKNMMVNFQESDIGEAFKIDNDGFPFGFEYLKHADFREINFGSSGFSDPDKINIAGNEYGRRGFEICPSCGKVRRNGEIKHAFDCTSARRSSEEQPLDCLYLYREFSSEAIRILLPLSFFSGSDQRLQSFTAAIMLGLKHRFNGNIGHLKYTIQEEPLAENRALKKKYLVIYDSVPGGTGYLKELMQSDKDLFTVFEYALKTLKGCDCNSSNEKDGCYHCLLAYRNSFEMMNISRNSAIETISMLLENKSRIVKIKTIGDIRQHKLIESELEGLFIESLRRIEFDGSTPELRKEVFSNRTGWYLRIRGKGYFILPQVELSKAEGVPINTRPDFIFYPEKEKETLPIAVYLDGFSWHVDTGKKSKVGDDTAKRMGLVKSGKYRVWSLSWEDVQSAINKKSPDYTALLGQFSQKMSKFAKHVATANEINFMGNIPNEDSFKLFVSYLLIPDARCWEWNAFIYAAAYLKDTVKTFDEIKGESEIILQSESLWDSIAGNNAEGMTCASVVISDKGKDDKMDVDLQIWIDRNSLQKLNKSELRLVCRLYDDEDKLQLPDFKSAWNGYLRLFNLYQFLPRSLFITSQGIVEDAYTFLEYFIPEKGITREAISPEYSKVLKTSTCEFLSYLKNNGVAIPAVDAIPYELLNEHNAIVAQAELAWPEKKIAVVNSSDEQSIAAFKKIGWQVVAEEEFNQGNKTLVNFLKDRKKK